MIRALARIGKRRDGAAGAREVLRHISLQEPLEGRNETGIGDRVLYFETNLPYPVDRHTDANTLAHMLCLKKTNKAARSIWHMIYSFEDGAGSVEQLVELSRRHREFAGMEGAEYASYVHADHAHLHLHMAICNQGKDGKPFDLLKDENLRSIANLSFAHGMPGILNANGLIPMPWRKAMVGSGASRGKSYSDLRDANSRQLAERIIGDPEGKLAELIASEDVETYITPSKNVGLVFNKTKFSLRDLNYWIHKLHGKTYLSADFRNTDTCPVFVPKHELRHIENDMTNLSKAPGYAPSLMRAHRTNNVDGLHDSILHELAGYSRFPSILKNMSKGPLGWLCQLVELCGGLSKGMDMDGPQR